MGVSIMGFRILEIGEIKEILGNGQQQARADLEVRSTTIGHPLGSILCVARFP